MLLACVSPFYFFRDPSCTGVGERLRCRVCICLNSDRQAGFPGYFNLTLIFVLSNNNYGTLVKLKQSMVKLAVNR